MVASLKSIVVPYLREQGFTGSFPHMRRIKGNGIDLIAFQFDRHGGGFVIEISSCDAGGMTTYWGKKIPPNKVETSDMPPNARLRIQPTTGPGTDSWFRYDKGDVVGENYDNVSLQVIALLEERAKPYWNRL